MIFEINKEQMEKLNKWKQEQNVKVAEIQKGKFPEEFCSFLIEGEAYYGTSGGSFKYIFIPTSIGLISIVKNAITREEIDLTDYENW